MGGGGGLKLRLLTHDSDTGGVCALFHEMTEAPFSMSERSARNLNCWVISKRTINSCFSTEPIPTGENTTDRFLFCRGVINRGCDDGNDYMRVCRSLSWIILGSHQASDQTIIKLIMWGGASMLWQHETSVPKHFCKTPTFCTLSACFSWVRLWVFFLRADIFPLEHTERCSWCFSLMHPLQRCVKREQIDTRWDVVSSRFQTERQQRMCKIPAASVSQRSLLKKEEARLRRVQFDDARVRNRKPQTTTYLCEQVRVVTYALWEAGFTLVGSTWDVWLLCGSQSRDTVNIKGGKEWSAVWEVFRRDVGQIDQFSVWSVTGWYSLTDVQLCPYSWSFNCAACAQILWHHHL